MDFFKVLARIVLLLTIINAISWVRRSRRAAQLKRRPARPRRRYRGYRGGRSKAADYHWEDMEQWAVREGERSVTPFDHGGYVQGPGFNPSDTMAHDFHTSNDFGHHNDF